MITGASRVGQVHENMAALEVVEALDETIMAKIDKALSWRADPPLALEPPHADLIGSLPPSCAVHERPGVVGRPNILSGFLSQHNRGMIVA